MLKPMDFETWWHLIGLPYTRWAKTETEEQLRVFALTVWKASEELGPKSTIRRSENL